MKNQLENFGDLNIFIDGGYLFYYSSFSAFNLWKKQYPERFRQRCPEKASREYPDLTNDDRFIHCLETKLKDNIDEIFQVIKKKIFEGYRPPNVKPKMYICIDCPSPEYWRRDIFPEYKIQRKLQPKQFDASAATKYIRDIIMPSLDFESYFGIQKIEAPRAEADDILMTLIRRINHPNNIIIGTDHDFIQVLDKARMFDLMGQEKDIGYISNKCIDTDEMTHETYLLTKIITGDNSDNIRGLFEQVGYKRAWKLIHDRETLKEKLSDKVVHEHFILNRNLIDCKRIPVKIQRDIVRAYIEVKH